MLPVIASLIIVMRHSRNKLETRGTEKLTPGFQKSSAKTTSDAADKLMPEFAAVILSTATRIVSSR